MMLSSASIRTSLTVIASLALPLLPAPADDSLEGDVNSHGVDIIGMRSRSAQIGDPAMPARRTAPSPVFEYLRIAACTGNSINHRLDDLCESAVRPCVGQRGTGVMTWIYRREAGTDQGWEFHTQTCDPEKVVATGQLTPGDIEREFANTPFGTPTATVQPPNNRTLVNLPVYLTSTWPDTGYRPGQTRTVTLLGHTIDLAIKLQHYRYDFGDGTSAGPTTSPGGPYPTGDIRHTYRLAGTYTITIDATLTADYRIDGGPWQPLRGTATRTTRLPTLTVLTATNRLMP